jgi:hypothetical protein
VYLESGTLAKISYIFAGGQFEYFKSKKLIFFTLKIIKLKSYKKATNFLVNGKNMLIKALNLKIISIVLKVQNQFF